MKKYFLPSIFIFLFLLLLQVLVGSDFVSSTLVPSPVQMIKVFLDQKALFLSSLYQTFLMTIWAFFLSTVLATILALVFDHFQNFQKAIWPLIIFFQTVPIVAIAPLLVIYLGFGQPTVLSAAFIVGFFPVLSSLQVGLQRATQTEKELFDFLKASSFQKLVYLKWPTAIPYWLSGLKSSAGLTVVGVVAGEFVAGGGLGALIDSARLQQRVDIVFMCLILLALIGLILSGLTEFLFKSIFKSYFVRH